MKNFKFNEKKDYEIELINLIYQINKCSNKSVEDKTKEYDELMEEYLNFCSKV